MSLAVALSSLLHMVPIRDATEHEFPFAVGYLADTWSDLQWHCIIPFFYNFHNPRQKKKYYFHNNVQEIESTIHNTLIKVNERFWSHGRFCRWLRRSQEPVHVGHRGEGLQCQRGGEGGAPGLPRRGQGHRPLLHRARPGRQGLSRLRGHRRPRERRQVGFFFPTYTWNASS